MKILKLRGLFVQLPGGSALESGKICKGDRVVAVGGQDVREAPVEDIAVHVKVSNPVQLKLARFKSAKQWQVRILQTSI